MTASELGPSRKGSPCLRNIKSGDTVTLAEIQGPGMIHHIWITVTDKTTEADRFVLRDLVLRMYWDDEESPSVETPLGDFFCCGFGEECIVNSLPVAAVPSRGLNCYFQMPFNKKARITLKISMPMKYRRFSIRLTMGFIRTLSRQTSHIFTHSGEERRSPSCKRTM